MFSLVLLHRYNCISVKLLIQQKNLCKSKFSLLIIKKEKTSSSYSSCPCCWTEPTAIINVSVEQQQHVPTSCYYRTPSDLLLYHNKRKCRRHQSYINSPQVHLFISPCVEVNPVAVPCYPRPERGDEVCAAVYL